MSRKIESDEDKIINAHCDMVAEAAHKILMSDKFYRHTLAELSTYIHNKEITTPIKDIRVFLYEAFWDKEFNLTECLIDDCIKDICKKVRIKICKICGKAFVALDNKTECCDYPSPYNPMITCKAYNSQVGISPSAKLYRTMYMKKSVKARRHGKGTNEDKKFQKWYKEATDVKNNYHKGLITEDEFILWLVKNDN